MDLHSYSSECVPENHHINDRVPFHYAPRYLYLSANDSNDDATVQRNVVG